MASDSSGQISPPPYLVPQVKLEVWKRIVDALFNNHSLNCGPPESEPDANSTVNLKHCDCYEAGAAVGHLCCIDAALRELIQAKLFRHVSFRSCFEKRLDDRKFNTIISKPIARHVRSLTLEAPMLCTNDDGCLLFLDPDINKSCEEFSPPAGYDCSEAVRVYKARVRMLLDVCAKNLTVLNIMARDNVHRVPTTSPEYPGWISRRTIIEFWFLHAFLEEFSLQAFPSLHTLSLGLPTEWDPWAVIWRYLRVADGSPQFRLLHNLARLSLLTIDLSGNVCWPQLEQVFLLSYRLCGKIGFHISRDPKSNSDPILLAPGSIEGVNTAAFLKIDDVLVHHSLSQFLVNFAGLQSLSLTEVVLPQRNSWAAAFRACVYLKSLSHVFFELNSYEGEPIKSRCLRWEEKPSRREYRSIRALCTERKDDFILFNKFMMYFRTKLSEEKEKGRGGMYPPVENMEVCYHDVLLIV